MVLEKIKEVEAANLRGEGSLELLTYLNKLAQEINTILRQRGSDNQEKNDKYRPEDFIGISLSDPSLSTVHLSMVLEKIKEVEAANLRGEGSLEQLTYLRKLVKEIQNKIK